MIQIQFNRSENCDRKVTFNFPLQLHANHKFKFLNGSITHNAWLLYHSRSHHDNNFWTCVSADPNIQYAIIYLPQFTRNQTYRSNKLFLLRLESYTLTKLWSDKMNLPSFTRRLCALWRYRFVGRFWANLESEVLPLLLWTYRNTVEDS